MSARKSTGKTPAGKCLTTGILFLSEDRSDLEKRITGEVTDRWSSLGSVDIECRHAGGGRKELAAALRKWSGKKGKDIVLTVGLSGHRKADIAPDVTGGLLDRRLPGIEEAMSLPPRRRPEDLLFRGRAGIRGGTIIVNLPSRPAALVNALKILTPVLVHAVEKIGGDESECAVE
jgi:molybdopterin biosynthesis enzyme MoaB